MADLDYSDVQGNILRGYRMQVVRHIVVHVDDRRSAREFLGAVVAGDRAHWPQLTTAAQWEAKPDVCLNVGFTANGLSAVGVSAKSLASFPKEFRDGAVARAAKVGDVDDSAPEHWDGDLGRPEAVHLIWNVYGSSPAHLDEATDNLESEWKRTGAFSVVSKFDGAQLGDDKVHFGYRDSIAQPSFDLDGAHTGTPDHQPTAPLGAVLLGHPTSFAGVSWRVPEPQALGLNGSFNAFRVLEQDVDGFEAFLRDTAAAHPSLSVELVAAKLMGRWRNGVPLVLSPDTPDAPIPNDQLNNFDYDDFNGVKCPLGAHIRRANPRQARIVQRSANHTRRLVRRGMPYGPAYDPAHPRDGVRRGLLGNFICANLIAQYEAIMYDWINLGLQDPRITSTNDPLVGANVAVQHPARQRRCAH